MTKKRGGLKNKLALSGMALLGCFIGGELFSRAWFFFLASPAQVFRYGVYEDIALVHRKEGPHHYLNHALRPGYRSSDGLNRHNALGFRGEEIIVPKPKGIFRIAVLGGSSTYTEFVKDYRKSFTVLLQGALNKKYGRPDIEVVNAGGPGYNSWESLINLEFRVLDLEPDLVIVYHGTNDVHARLVQPSSYRGDNSGRRKPWKVPEIRLWERSVFLRLIGGKLGYWDGGRGLGAAIDAPTSMALLSREAHHEAYQKAGLSPGQILDRNRPVYFERNLRNMVAICREHGVGIILATWAHTPKFGDYAASPYYQKGFKENNDTVKAVAKRTGVPVFDFEDVMPGDRRYWHDGRHVNEEGAALKAELFARYLASYLGR